MGKQSRLRAERQGARQRAGRATSLLRELFQNIRNRSYQTSRRSWELMLEILGHYCDVNAFPEGCLSADAKKLLPDLGNVDALIADYGAAWDEELQWSASGGSPVSDPIGTILEENDGTNEKLGQFFTPPEIVRLLSALTMGNRGEPTKRERVLDPCCGTGRFALDALVHHPHVVVDNIDLDLWMMRSALLNFRLAPRFTTARETIPSEDGSGRRHRQTIMGRARIIRADSLIIDADCIDNWRYSGLWSPPPWESTMKVRGFDGTYEEFRAHKPRKEVAEREEQAARAHSEQLAAIDLDEAQLHREMVRAASAINVPAPDDRIRDGLPDVPFDPARRPALPFGETDAALPLLRGRSR